MSDLDIAHMGWVWAERVGRDNTTVADLLKLLDGYRAAIDFNANDPSEENAQMAADMRLNVLAFLRRSGTLAEGVSSDDAITFADGVRASCDAISLGGLGTSDRSPT